MMCNNHFTITVIRGDLGSRTKREDFMKNASRRHFITRQDCRNVGRKLADFSKHRHTDDAISVDRLIRELNHESPSPIIAYKSLILNTTFQMTVFSLSSCQSFKPNCLKHFQKKLCVP